MSEPGDLLADAPRSFELVVSLMHAAPDIDRRILVPESYAR